MFFFLISPRGCALWGFTNLLKFLLSVIIFYFMKNTQQRSVKKSKKRMFDHNLHICIRFGMFLKNVEQHLLDASLRPHTGWRALSSVICVFVWLHWFSLLCAIFSLLYFFPLYFAMSRIIVLELSSDRKRANKCIQHCEMQNISNTNWVISNSWNSHISFSGAAFFSRFCSVCD